MKIRKFINMRIRKLNKHEEEVETVKIDKSFNAKVHQFDKWDFRMTEFRNFHSLTHLVFDLGLLSIFSSFVLEVLFKYAVGESVSGS